MTSLSVLQRFAAWHYKQNRKFYELHKSCCFKLGCTFFVVLIQIMCNKSEKKNNNLTYEKTDEDERDTSDDNTKSKKISNKKKKKKISSRRKIKIESYSTYSDDTTDDDKTQKTKYKTNAKTTQLDVIADQPSSVLPDSKQVQFSKATSTLQFPPSFNLNSNQHSTPLSKPANTSTQTNLSPASVCHVPQIHAIDITTYDIDQKKDIVEDQNKMCQIS